MNLIPRVAETPDQLFSRLQSYKSPVSRIAALGVEIPDRVVNNEELAAMIEAPAKLRRLLPRIISRTTWNRERRYAAPQMVPSDLAAAASRRALERAGWSAADVDTVIFASTDTDILEPATANILQEKLGIHLANAFDVSNACNSILQAINVANSLISSGAARRVLIASGEIGSLVCTRRIDSLEELKFKLGSLTLGDAGAALLMEPAMGSDGITEINLLSLGEFWRLCHVPENEDWRHRGGTMNPWFYLDMKTLGRVARELTITYLSHYTRRHPGFTEASRFTDFVDWLVPHQISRRLIEEISGELDLDPGKVCITADRFGNTGSTAIPLALEQLWSEGQLSPGSGQELFLYGAASGFGLGHVRMVI